MEYYLSNTVYFIYIKKRKAIIASFSLIFYLYLFRFLLGIGHGP